MPNEFTIYHDAHGQPVRRALSKMLSGEVMAALGWHREEFARRERAAEPGAKAMRAIQAGALDLHSVPIEMRQAFADAARGAFEAAETLARLLAQVRVALEPHWRRNPDMAMGELIRRYWPEPLSVFSSADNNS